MGFTSWRDCLRVAPAKPDALHRGSRGDYKAPIEAINEDINKASIDSNSAPIGTAYNVQPVPIFLSDIEGIALDLYEKSKRDPDSPIGFIKRAEIMSFAKDWHLNYEATGGLLHGSVIKNPKAALEGWLRSCADNQSKRCRELWVTTEKEDEDEPF